jgi:ABC transporter DrrB family efflux protein
MTAITTPAPETIAGSLVPGAGAAFITAALQSARRTVIQFFRTPQLLMMGTVQGALFLFMFRYIFGGAIDTGSNAEYVDFLVPGFLVTTILWIGMAAPAGVAEDAASGVHDRLRSLPISRSAIVVGRSLADLSLTVWGMLVTTAVGFAVGFRTHADAGEIVAAIGLLLVATYAFMWVFLTLGLRAKSAQAAQGMTTLLVIPLTFVSSAYVPADSLPGWMQPVADHQPLTVITNAVRSLLLGGTDAAGVGHSSGYWAALTLLWCGGIMLLFGTLAVTRFARAR